MRHSHLKYPPENRTPFSISGFWTLLVFFLIFFFLPSNEANAQSDPPPRIIPSLTDWIEEINNWPDSVYVVQNIKILFDPIKDSLITGPAFEAGWEPEKIVTTIHKTMDVTNWEFESAFGTLQARSIRNIHFMKPVRLSDYKGLGVAIVNSIFEERFSFSYQYRYSYFHLISCTFEKWVGLFDFEAESFLNIFE